MCFHPLRRGFSQTEEVRQPTNRKDELGLARLLKKKKNHKTKRGGRKHQRKTENLTIFSTNAAGLKFKVQSLKNELKNSQAAAFSIQESHFIKKGKLKISSYANSSSVAAEKGATGGGDAI